MQVKEIRIIKRGDKESDYDVEKVIDNGVGQIITSEIKDMALIDILQTELLPFFEEKKLKDEMVDLRMHLANAEIQANKVIGLLPTKYGLPCKVRWHIQEADNELCEIAQKMGLDKIDLVKPGRAK